MSMVNGKKFREVWRRYWPNQRAFAKDAHVNPAVVVSADNNREIQKGSLDAMLEAIAQKTGTSLNDILKYVENEPPKFIATVSSKNNTDAHMDEVYELLAKLPTGKQQVIYDWLGAHLSRIAKQNGSKGEAIVSSPRRAGAVR